MAILSNPHLAYFLMVLGVTLIFLANINAKTVLLNSGVLLAIVATVLGFLYLRMNPWAFLVVVLSPVLFYFAIRQARPQNLLVVISIFMLALGSFFIFVDPENQPVVSNRMAWVSVLSAAILWLSTDRLRNVEGARSDANSVVGLIGEVITDIEPHSAGSVLVDGEIWQARSKEPISAGSTVRVLRQDGFWLTVKMVENIPPK
ncbi:hypothetical protein KQH54_00010 [bacterium]|nr:hypothetical protein [bacterium]